MFAHSLNLVVKHGLKEIQKVRDKIKGIVGNFKRSSQAAAKNKDRIHGFRWSKDSKAMIEFKL